MRFTYPSNFFINKNKIRKKKEKKKLVENKKSIIIL